MGIAAIGVGAALAFALPAGAAVGAQSPPLAAVQLGSTATLDANGAVVFAPTTVTCRSGASAWLSVQVTEAVGNDIASGGSSTNIDACAGRPQHFTAAVTPTQHPFRKGVAFAQATLQACDNTGCKTVVDQKVIQIVTR
jgi:hypothetical protein